MADQSADRELKNALAQIEKQFGKGSIMQLGEASIQDVQGISSGALSLDIALGGRGLPLMHALMDHVDMSYDGTGMRVRLKRNLPFCVPRH